MIGRRKEWLRALDRLWYPPAPAIRLSCVRALVGVYASIYLLIRAPSFVSVTRFASEAFAPVGPVSFLDGPLPAPLVYALVASTVALAIPFTIGMKYRVSAPLFAALLLWITSYRSSWGMKFHTENLLTLHVALLAFAPAAEALSWDARTSQASGIGLSPPDTEEHGRYGWALRAMGIVTVVTYVLAGIAKLRNSGWEWAEGDVLRLQIAYDNLRKIELGSIHAPLGAALVRYPWVFPPLAWATLLLELGAPVALFHRRLAAIWAILAWAFHVGVLALMAIAFPYPLSGVAYASFFRVEEARRLAPVRRWLEKHA